MYIRYTRDVLHGRYSLEKEKEETDKREEKKNSLFGKASQEKKKLASDRFNSWSMRVANGFFSFLSFHGTNDRQRRWWNKPQRFVCRPTALAYKKLDLEFYIHFQHTCLQQRIEV